MIDPTADNGPFRLYRAIPDTRPGLLFLHAMGWLASRQKPANVTISQRVIAVEGRQLPIWIVAPAEAAAPLPIVLHLHGGGYAVGRPDQDLMLMGHYVHTHPAIFVAPRYRRSLEAPFPAALDDCYDTLIWLRDHAAELGGDPSRIFVMGESAGGGLTAAVALRSRDRNEVAIAGQFPLYAMLDDRPDRMTTCDPRALTWSAGKNRKAWRSYLGNRSGGDDVPAEAAPARAGDLAGLPPAIGMVGDQDLFLDENQRYFDRLTQAGVPTRFEVFRGGYHAVELLAPKSEVGMEMRRWLDEAYVQALATLRADQP